MDVQDATLGRILEGSNQYLVPLYQRPYSWTAKNWDTLWQDIVELTEVRRHSPDVTHFTGTLVLEASSVTTGMTQFVVVDGQQRLTTLSVLLAAITQHWESEGEQQAAKRIRDQYLIYPYADDSDSHYRLRPANFDEAVFRAVINGKRTPGSKSNIDNAYGFFRREIKKLADSNVELRELEQATLSGLKFVTITAKSDDNVYRIFESINNTGVRLTQADLVRNYVFMKLGALGERVYDQLWLPIVDGLGPDDVEAVFWIDAQWRNPESRKLNVYDEQKKHLKDMGDEALISYLENVLDIANALRQLRSVTDIADRSLKQQVSRYAELKIPGALVLATRILYLQSRSESSAEDAARALKVLESYLVRRMLAGIPVNSIGRISASAAAELHGPDVSNTVHRLLSTGRRNYVPDAEILRILVESPIYSRLRRDSTKLVLQRLLEEEQGKDNIDFATMTIEHILPQKLTGDARDEFARTLEPSDDIAEVHEALVHTIGNLTLTNYNSELSNSAFSVKRMERLQNTGVLANQEIARRAIWGKAEILERSEQLASRAIEMWQGPDESLLNRQQDTVFDTIDTVVSMLESGYWTTYGDVAKAVGTVGQVVGAAVSRMGAAEGAWRVLRAGGTVSPDFAWPEDSPFTGRTCEDVLEEEGVKFEHGKANPDQQLSADAIRELLDGVYQDDATEEAQGAFGKQ